MRSIDMRLQEYLENGGLNGLALAVGIAPTFLNQISKGNRPAPIRFCFAIEQATNGKVTRKDLRPNDWQEIWPEIQ